MESDTTQLIEVIAEDEHLQRVKLIAAWLVQNRVLLSHSKVVTIELSIKDTDVKGKITNFPDIK